MATVVVIWHSHHSDWYQLIHIDQRRHADFKQTRSFSNKSDLCVCLRVSVWCIQGLSGRQDGRAEAVLGSSVDGGEDAESHGSSERCWPLTLMPLAPPYICSNHRLNKRWPYQSAGRRSCDQLFLFVLFLKIKKCLWVFEVIRLFKRFKNSFK